MAFCPVLIPLVLVVVAVLFVFLCPNCEPLSRESLDMYGRKQGVPSLAVSMPSSLGSRTAHLAGARVLRSQVASWLKTLVEVTALVPSLFDTFRGVSKLFFEAIHDPSIVSKELIESTSQKQIKQTNSLACPVSDVSMKSSPEIRRRGVLSPCHVRYTCRPFAFFVVGSCWIVATHARVFPL